MAYSRKFCSGFVLFWSLQIPWPSMTFFNDVFKFSKTSGLVVTFKNFQNFPCFGVFFDLKQFNRNKLWCSPKSVPFALFNYSCLSYIVLALPSAVSKLPNKPLIFHHFQGTIIKFHDFTGLENEILKFHDFPGFPWPVRATFFFDDLKVRSLRSHARANWNARKNERNYFLFFPTPTQFNLRTINPSRFFFP